MNASKVAYRYAKSLLEVAQEKKILAGVYKDMLLVSDVISKNLDLAEYISSPVVKTLGKIDISKKIFEKKITQLSLDFIILIIDNRREHAFGQIIKRFIQLYDEVRGIEVAKVTSAVELDKKIITSIRKHVAKLTGKEVELETEIKESIIGGYILTVGDYQYDASVKRNISKLRIEFNENLYIQKL